MAKLEDSNLVGIQAKLFDFAITELVYQQRSSFKPLWSVDSWAKFLIWLALNCGLSGERESLEMFAKALGAPLTSRMRRIFFERTLADLDLKIIGEPADNQVLILPTGDKPLTLEMVTKAVERTNLTSRVSSNKNDWKPSDSLYVIPWSDDL